MSRYLLTSLMTILICTLQSFAFPPIVNNLDPEHLVILDLSDKDKAIVAFEGKQYILDSNTLYLDGEMSDAEAAASPYIYNNVREALEMLRANADDQTPKTLLIAPGVYWVDDPDDPAERQATESGSVPYGMVITCDRIVLMGMAINPEYVVLACNRGHTQGAAGNFTMFNLICNEIETQNITFGNFCNVDLNYPLKEEYSRQKRNSAIVQAQLIDTKADKVYAHNCRFISRLNLHPFFGGHRILFDNCYLECSEESIPGSAVYLHSTLKFFSSRPMPSAENYGTVFLDCDIISNSIGTQYICRNNGGVTMIDTRIRTLRDDNLKLSFNYTPKTDSWYYSNVTINGKKQDIEGGSDISYLKFLNAFKIVSFSNDGPATYNILNLMAGNDGWDPLHQKDIIPAEYVGMPVVMQIVRNDNGERLSPLDDEIGLSTTFLRWGGYQANEEEIKKVADEGVFWKKNDATVILQKTKYSANLITKYRENTPYSGIVTAYTATGLQSNMNIDIAPFFFEAPTFATQPKILLDANMKKLVLEYEFSKKDQSNTHQDHSDIIWYRYTQKNMSDTVPIYWSQAIYGGKEYELCPADANAMFLAVIYPRYSDSYIGRSKQCRYETAISPNDAPWIFTEENEYSTNFYYIPNYYQPRHEKGVWSFDAYKPLDTKDFSWDFNPMNAWEYGEGQNGMKGLGLYQVSRGARCSYIPARQKCNYMKAVVEIDPGKTGGQGFGSATKQYFDICVMFDPITLTGYALRIERIINYDNAVSFQIVKYTNGETEPIGKSVLSNCFISTCTVEIEMKGNKIQAWASTNGSLKEVDDPAIKSNVYLEEKVTKNEFTGFCMQHTGTTGSSALMIHKVSLNWK